LIPKALLNRKAFLFIDSQNIKTKQNEAKRSKTKQNEAKRSKTKQNEKKDQQ